MPIEGQMGRADWLPVRYIEAVHAHVITRTSSGPAVLEDASGLNMNTPVWSSTADVQSSFHDCNDQNGFPWLAEGHT